MARRYRLRPYLSAGDVPGWDRAIRGAVGLNPFVNQLWTNFLPLPKRPLRVTGYNNPGVS